MLLTVFYSLANHSKSKKHAENVLLLREEMIEDDARMGNGQAEDGHDGGGATVLNDTSYGHSGRATTEDGELGDDDEEDVLEDSAGEEEVVDSRVVYNPTNKSKYVLIIIIINSTLIFYNYITNAHNLQLSTQHT